MAAIKNMLDNFEKIVLRKLDGNTVTGKAYSKCRAEEGKITISLDNNEKIKFDSNEENIKMISNVMEDKDCKIFKAISGEKDRIVYIRKESITAVVIDR